MVLRLKTTLVRLAIGCFAAAGPVMANGLSNQVETATTTEPASTTFVLKPTSVPRSITVYGSLVAQDEARLSVKVEGRLESIAVDLGSFVKKGDVIAQLEKVDYELQLRQAQAALAQARARLGLSVDAPETDLDPEKTTLAREARAVRDEAKRNRDRIASLTASGVLPAAELETVESNYQVAESKYETSLQEVNNRLALLRERAVEVEMARQRLSDTTLRAPFDGAIQERAASPGEYLRMGTHVATLVRMNPLRLRIEIPERQAWQVQPGQRTTVHIEGSDAPHEGAIARISPSISETNRMLIAEAELENDGRLRPGAFVRADVVVQESPNVLVVPRTAIHVFAGVEKIYVVEGGKSVEKTVRTGQKFGPNVELLSGAKAGDVVVRNASGLGVSAK